MKKEIRRTCPVCKRRYKANKVRLSHGRQTTCSRACSYQLRASLKTKRCQVICSACGKEFSRAASHIKSKHEGVYCSRKCHYAGRQLGITKRIVVQPYTAPADYDREAAGKRAWVTRIARGTNRHSEATKEKLRIATARAIAATPGRQVSKVENKVAKELRRRSVGFRRQVPIRDSATGRFIGLADFVLSNGVVLEVNGTFWHADPRVFPNGPIYPSQKRTCERYAAKLTRYDSLGIKCVELWESDIGEDLEKAVTKCLRSAGL